MNEVEDGSGSGSWSSNEGTNLGEKSSLNSLKNNQGQALHA